MANAPDKPRYSPQETALVRQETVASIVNAQNRIFERAPEKTNLNDVTAVQRVANTCMTECAQIGCLPNFEMLAASLGYSRRGLYDFIERHPETETAAFIDRVRTAWASMRQMAADRGAVSEAMSIFILLNSGQGFTNRHDLEIRQPENPFAGSAQDDEALARKYMAGAVKAENE